MAENSNIEWCHHTFNPWIGCTKLSGACDFCYAEVWNQRFDGGANWGPHAPRRRTKTWGNPVRWNRQAEGAKERPRVFCASLADVFDNHKSIEQSWRDDLWRLIEATPNLDWLLLTKRPQNILRFVPSHWREEGFPDHIWLGTTVENQEEADRRVPHLLKVPAKVHYLSMEPLLGEVDIRRWLYQALDVEAAGLADDPMAAFMLADAIDEGTGCGPMRPKISWVITGGESGPNYRHADPDWFRHLRDQCAAADVPFLFKQWEGKSQPEIKALGRELDGVIHDGYPINT